MITVFGIKNCDTVKKALRWLDEYRIEYSFHDFKSKGVSEEKLKSWCAHFGWEVVLNKKGLTWKQLAKEDQDKIKSETDAIRLMKEKTSIIKRPILENREKPVSIGFNDAEFTQKFGGK